MASQAATLRPETEARESVRIAPRWKVILHDDDITTFEFVIELLSSVFRKPLAEAVALTQEVHDSGSALVVVTSFEHAELYCEQVRSLARPRGYPLVASMEPAG